MTKPTEENKRAYMDLLNIIDAAMVQYQHVVGETITKVDVMVVNGVGRCAGIKGDEK